MAPREPRDDVASTALTGDHHTLPPGKNRLPTLAADIKAAHLEAQRSAQAMAERALEAGRLLIEAKEAVRHGEWSPWLKEHVDLPERTARRYMQLARSGVKSATVADLGIVGALDLMATPAPPIPSTGQIVAGVDGGAHLMYLWPSPVSGFTHTVTVDTDSGAISGFVRALDVCLAWPALLQNPPENFDFKRAQFFVFEGDKAADHREQADELRLFLAADRFKSAVDKFGDIAGPPDRLLTDDERKRCQGVAAELAQLQEELGGAA